MGAPEAYVEKYLVAEIAAIGGRAMKFTSPGTSGVPDRVVMAPGAHTLFVELKRPGGRPRPLQVVTIEAMRESGADVRVIDTREGVDDLVRELRMEGGAANGDGD